MSNQGKIRVIPLCAECSSNNVVADAAARWNIESQDWEVVTIFDKGHCCDDCGAADIQFAWANENLQETPS
jgi:hypothetical protein